MILLFIFVYLIIFLLMAAAVSSLFGWFRGAPYLPTPKRVIREMLRLAKLQPGETVYDLGSGDGRVLVLAAREFKAKGVGYEVSNFYYYWSKLKVKFLCPGRVIIKRKNFFQADLSVADVVVLFLLPRTNVKLQKKIISELPAESRVVSRYFTLPGLRQIASNNKFHLYLYQK